MSELSEPEKESIRQSEDYKATKPILEGFLTTITKIRSKMDVAFPPEYVYATRYGMFKKNCSDFSKRWEETKRVSMILRDLKRLDEFQEIPTKFRAMNKTLIYLGLVESLGVALLDIVLLLLIANEREVHTGGRFSKHATKLSQLEEIRLANKLDFLNSEGLTMFGRFINRKIRNKIAHLGFTINEDGRVIGDDGSTINIDAKIDDFWRGVHILTLIFEDIGFVKWLEVE